MQENGVAVRIGLRNHGSADRSSATGLVFDHEGVAQLSRNLIQHDARDGVVGIACGEWADDLYRPRGPRLRISRRRCGEERGTRDRRVQNPTSFHLSLPPFPSTL